MMPTIVMKSNPVNSRDTSFYSASDRFTLDGLYTIVGSVDERVVKALFAKADQDTMFGEGLRVDSQRILDAVPRFCGQAREIWANLTPQQKRLVVGYTSEFDPVLIRETIILRDLKARHDDRFQACSGSRLRRKVEARQAAQDGITLRDQAVQSLRTMLGRTSPEWVGLEDSIGTAETAEKLARGLEWLSQAMLEVRKSASPELLKLMDLTGLGADYASDLAAAAKAVRDTAAAASLTPTADTRVTQRQLDVQDGRVLYVVGLIYRAFRAANRRNPAILVPELGPLASFFVPHRSVTDPHGHAVLEQAGQRH